MSFNISFHDDVKTATRYLNNVEKDAIPLATIRALNRAGSETKTESSRIIRTRVKIKASDIKKRIKVYKARRGQPVLTLLYSADKIPLLALAARQVRKGVTANVAGKRQLYKGRFIATMASGHKGVFEHASGKARMQAPKRVRRGKNVGKKYYSTKIRERFVPTPAVIVVQDAERDQIEAFARASFQKNLNRDLQYFINRFK